MPAIFGYPPYSKRPARGKKRGRMLLKHFAPFKGKPSLKRRRKIIGDHKKVVALSKRVSNLGKMIDAVNGHLAYRAIDYQNVVSSVAQVKYIFGSMNTIGTLSSALSKLKYYDIKIPPTLLTVDLTSAAFDISATFVKTSISLTFKANYLTPVNYVVYYFTAKRDNSSDPIALMGNLDADLTNVDFENPDMWPSDYSAISDLWSTKIMGRGRLESGSTKTFTHYENRPFKINMATKDIHIETYQVKHHAGFMMLRFWGDLSHDTVENNEFDVGSTKIDNVFKKYHDITYNAGGDIDVVYVQTDSTGFTTAGVTGLVTVPELIVHSAV